MSDVKDQQDQDQDKQLSRNRPSRKDIYFVDVSLMIPSFITNIREDYGDLSELVESILNDSNRIPPVRGFVHQFKNEEGADDVGYVITEGHRRMQAGLIAQEKIDSGKVEGKKKGDKIVIPFYPEPRGYTDLQRLDDMFLMNQGKDLNMMEQANGIKKYIEEHGLAPKEIAKRLHKSITYVSNCLLLIEAPESLRDQISDGIIKPSTVVELMKKMPFDEVATIVTDTIERMSKKANKKSQLEFYTPAGDGELNPNIPANENSGVVPGSESKKREIGIGAKVEDDGEPLVLGNPDDESGQFRNSNDGGVIGLKVAVTQKDINETLAKYNSLQAVKRMLKKYPDTTFNPRPEKSEELIFLQNVIEGNISGHDIWNRFFDISSNAELEDQLKN